MRKALLSAIVLVLLLPPAAAAKELSSVTICGAEGCRTIQRPPQQIASGGDGIPEPAPAATSYFTVTMTVKHEAEEESWQIFYIPGPRMLAFRGDNGGATFELLHGEALDAWLEAARGLAPFARPVVKSGSLGGAALADPQSYLRLFTIDAGDAVFPSAQDFQPIVLRADRPSPWTDLRYLMFSPSTGELERGSMVVRLPDELAATVAARASLERPIGGAGGGFDWPLVTLALATAFGLGLAAVVLVRRGDPMRAAPGRPS